MNRIALSHPQTSTPDEPGVEFGRSAEGFAVARIGDVVLAMLPLSGSGGYLASAWRVKRPLRELTRNDFLGHDGRLADEAAFRARVFETTQHQTELLTLHRRQTRMVCSTPWGVSQLALIYADGVVAHSTAGHGGFRLSAARNAKVNSELRIGSGWYEEDADWAIVALTFPDLFTSYERKIADRTIRDGWPDAWEVIFGRPLQPGESHGKDRRVFEEKHKGSWIVTSAIHSAHHADMTEVVAVLVGRPDRNDGKRRFLVPRGDYAERGPFGFIIDEERHSAYDGPSSFVAWQGRKAP